MTDGTYPASGTAEPVHPVWGEPFEDQVLEASGPDPAKVVALQQAVKLCCREMAPAEQDPVGVALAVATRFEAYLTTT